MYDIRSYMWASSVHAVKEGRNWCILSNASHEIFLPYLDKKKRGYKFGEKQHRSHLNIKFIRPCDN